MPMNQMNHVIQERRKALGLTQEQVAEYLNVSIPAVSKWEKGATSPDISLLPPLARLLGIDLNTLFCFQEDITRQEIGYFCNKIADIAETKGIAEGFEAAKQKINEYPHSEALLHCLTIQLDGLFTMSGTSLSGSSPSGTSPDEMRQDEMRQYEDLLAAWYDRLAESNDIKIKNSANYMMASRLIRKGDYDKAQEALDRMPDREDIVSSMADKLMLQTVIYQHQGKSEKAVKELQGALLLSLNKVQLLLYKLMDAELASGKKETAKSIAEKARQMTGLFDLWEYNAFVAPLEIALSEKDPGACITILRDMLEAMVTPWDMSQSPLFYRISKSSNSSRSSDPRKMLPAILTQLERDSEYDFLRDRDEFKELIARYKA